MEELDGVLGTKKWMIKAQEAVDPFESYDRKYKGLKAKRPERKEDLVGDEEGRRVGDGVKAITVAKEKVEGLDW